MPESNSSISSSKRWPVAAILATVIILAFEAFVAANKESFMAGLEISARMKREKLTNPEIRDDVAIFGDSRLFSVRPEQVSMALGGGLRVNNYTWAFLGIEGYDYVLEMYLKYKKRSPRIIVADLPQELFGVPEHWMSLHGDPDLRERAFRILPLGDLMNRALRDGGWRLLWEAICFEMTPASTQYRDGIVLVAKSYIRGEGWPPRLSSDRRILEGMAKNGSFILVGPDVVPPDYLEQYKKNNAEMGLQENKNLVKVFEQFLQRASDHNIQVILLNPPQPRSVYDYLNSLGALGRYEIKVNEWLSRYGNFHTAEPLLPVLPDEQFGDAYHVNNGGDLAFQTQILAGLEPFRELMRTD